MEQRDGQVFLAVGDAIRVRMPYSEVCSHMRVAGKPMTVQLVGDEYPMAQLLGDDGRPFSAPILLGEAGIYSDGQRHYVPTRNLISTAEPHSIV